MYYSDVKLFYDIHDEIIENWIALSSPLYTKEQLRNISESILPVYYDAILNRNYGVYVWGDREGQQVAHYISEMTGYAIGDVHFYLKNLQDSAARGFIDAKYYNPSLSELKEAQAALRQETTNGFFKKTFLPEIDKNINKILLTAAGVAVVYLLGRRII